jgi:hypothetical protein
VTADNASSNNVQVATLFGLENFFDVANHVRCFNHSIQLSCKALIKPFNAGMGQAECDIENSPNDAPSLEEFETDNDDTDNSDTGLFEDADEGDISEDEDKSLREKEHSSLLDNTSAVCETVSKV